MFILAYTGECVVEMKLVFQYLILLINLSFDIHMRMRGEPYPA